VAANEPDRILLREQGGRHQSRPTIDTDFAANVEIIDEISLFLLSS
jgi:hypothetical protein